MLIEPLNTRLFSDKNYWYLRGIETLLTGIPERKGEINKIDLQISINLDLSFIEPCSIIYLGINELTAVLYKSPRNCFMLFKGRNYEPYAIIDLDDNQYYDFCTIGNDIILISHGKILKLTINYIRLSKFIPQIKTKSVEQQIPSIKFDKFLNIFYSIDGLFPDINTHILAWTHKHAKLQLLCWRSQTSDIWISEPISEPKNSEPNSYQVIFKTTNMGINKNILSNIKINCIHYHKNTGCIYLTDDNNSSIFYSNLNNGKINLIHILNSKNKEFRLDTLNDSCLISPHGIMVYSLSDCIEDKIFNHLKINNEAFPEIKQDREVSVDIKQKLLLNPFLVVIDKESKLAVTIKTTNGIDSFDRNVNILPLMGEFPEIKAKNSMSNLAKYPLDNAESIVRGPNGSILFWAAGITSAYVLSPGFDLINKKPKLAKNNNNNTSKYPET